MAIAGSHSTNGVVAIHSELLRTKTVKDLAEMFPERFSRGSCRCRRNTAPSTRRKALPTSTPASNSLFSGATIGSLLSSSAPTFRPATRGLGTNHVSLEPALLLYTVATLD